MHDVVSCECTLLGYCLWPIGGQQFSGSAQIVHKGYRARASSVQLVHYW